MNAPRSPDGVSTTMRKMRLRTCLLTHFLPEWARCRESQVQFNLKLTDANAQRSRAGRRTTPASSRAKAAGASPKTVCLRTPAAAADVVGSKRYQLPNRQVSHEQVAPWAEGSKNQGEKKPHLAQHEPISTRRRAQVIWLIRAQIAFSRGTTWFTRRWLRRSSTISIARRGKNSSPEY
jgi:hypothetical protein